MIEGEAPVVTLTEEEWWRLPERLDRLLKSEEARRFGYVKIIFPDDVKGQSTKLQDYLKLYPPHLHATNLKKSTLQRGCRTGSRDSLFLVDQKLASPADINSFASHVRDPPKDSCCVDALDKAGVTGYLNHLQSVLFSLSGKPPVLRSVGRAPHSKYQIPKSRLADVLAVPLTERGTFVSMSMASEVVTPAASSSSVTGCTCTSCINLNVEFADNQKQDGICYYANVPVEKPLLKLTENYKMSYTTFLSMLSEQREYFLGVSCPAAYVGIAHSLFNFHVEDMSLFSINVIHDGDPKCWIIIPPTSLRDVDNLLAREGMGGDRTCSQRLSHKCYFILPQLLEKNKIPHSVVIQKKGEGILLLPNAVHGSANLGVNLAEAMNIATKGWLPYGCVSAPCGCNGPPVHYDLTTVLMKEEMKGLLQAYTEDNVVTYLRDDEYFQQSILHPAFRGQISTSSSSTSESNLQKKRKKQSVQMQVTCPVPECGLSCNKSKKKWWKDHLKTSHPAHCCRPLVKNFCEDHQLDM